MKKKSKWYLSSWLIFFTKETFKWFSFTVCGIWRFDRSSKGLRPLVSLFFLLFCTPSVCALRYVLRQSKGIIPKDLSLACQRFYYIRIDELRQRWGQASKPAMRRRLRIKGDIRTHYNKKTMKKNIPQCRYVRRAHLYIITHLIPQQQFVSLIMNSVLKGFLVDSQAIIIVWCDKVVVEVISKWGLKLWLRNCVEKWIEVFEGCKIGVRRFRGFQGVYWLLEGRKY